MKKYFSVIMVSLILLISSISYANHKTTNAMMKGLDELINETPFDTNSKYLWIVDEEKTEGSVHLLEGFVHKDTEEPCRIFELENIFSGKFFRAKGLLCLTGNGTWDLVEFKRHPDNPKMNPSEGSTHKYIPHDKSYEANSYSF